MISCRRDVGGLSSCKMSIFLHDAVSTLCVFVSQCVAMMYMSTHEYSLYQCTIIYIYTHIYIYIHIYNTYRYCIIEESLEVKLPTIWTDGKAQPGRSSDMEQVRSEKIRDGEDQRGRKSEERRCRCAKR